ncbi:MAG: hypothetical protein EPN47_19210 [Acidobacteria bacterium]|nr:MAG: hypothetical protein EPN47_19210 [Acidobacteriota bacterium]
MPVSDCRFSLHRSFYLASVGLLVLLACAPVARATQWETLFTAQDVRDRLATPSGREQALAFCRRMGISKVYIEVFRDGYQSDAATLKASRNFFRDAGLQVSGCVTTTGLGKPSTGWKVAACYTNRANQQHLAEIFRYAANLFNEIMIDDFFFTDCECSECTAAKGPMSWKQYRDKLMVEMSNKNVLGAARAVNPQVKVILKFPQWYDSFQDRGYVVDKESEIYDRIWVGTELRDPSSNEWGHTQQYRGFFLYRWLANFAGAKEGGGWFDPYGTDPAFYLDQAYVTVLAGAPEIFLFHYGELDSDKYRAQAGALAGHRSELESLAKLVGDWDGIPAYKPPNSDPGNEPYIFDQIGMLGIPLLPTAHFPAKARAALFTAHVLENANFVPELDNFLESGGTAFVSESLALRLNADPRLAPDNHIVLAKDELLKQVPEGSGKIIVFSDQLPRLAYVTAGDQVKQLDPKSRDALKTLRAAVGEFVPTSLDAPPRVAIFPMHSHVAIANFTELPVACHLTGMGGKATKFVKLFGTSEARVSDKGTTLYLPAHGVMVVR